VANSGLFGSTGNAAAAPSSSGPAIVKPTGSTGFSNMNFGAPNNASQAQAPIPNSTFNNTGNSFMMSANNQQ